MQTGLNGVGGIVEQSLVLRRRIQNWRRLLKELGRDRRDRALGVPLATYGSWRGVPGGASKWYELSPFIFSLLLVLCGLFSKEISCILSQTSEVKLRQKEGEIIGKRYT